MMSPTALHLTGHSIIWLLFSVLATLLQWTFHSAGLLSADLMTVATIIGGPILIAAGAYQFTGLKDVCLSSCRSPLDFLVTGWREGPRGAEIMGLRHGGYCLGCCWHLMLILFVVGAMNLAWVAVIAAYVLLEKALPFGRWLSMPVGVAIMGWGA